MCLKIDWWIHIVFKKGVKMKKVLRRYLLVTVIITCLTCGTAYAYNFPFMSNQAPRSMATVEGSLSTLDVSCYSTLCGASLWNKSGSNRYLSVGVWAYDANGSLINLDTGSGVKANGSGVSATVGTQNGDKAVGQGKIYNGTSSGSGVAETLNNSVNK